MSLFTCPICAAALSRGERVYTCPGRHSFDIAREGYVHLLPANRKHSAEPGDDKAMVAARTQFLDGGWYAPLRRALCALACAYAPDRPAVLDAGCGEGYYAQGLWHALSAAGKPPVLAGVDLSRPALKRAARRVPGMECAVASVYHLPLGTQSVDLVVNCFSPMAAAEFARVLRPGGGLLYVVPGPDHLWEMKEVLYPRPYRNEELLVDYPGFAPLGITPAESRFTLTGGDIMALFSMTPYAWKSPREGVDRLRALDALDVTAQFRIHAFRREDRPL